MLATYRHLPHQDRGDTGGAHTLVTYKSADYKYKVRRPQVHRPPKQKSPWTNKSQSWRSCGTPKRSLDHNYEAATYPNTKSSRYPNFEVSTTKTKSRDTKTKSVDHQNESPWTTKIEYEARDYQATQVRRPQAPRQLPSPLTTSPSATTTP